MISFGGTSSTYWLWMIESTSVKSRRFSYVAAESLLLLATPPPSDSESKSRSAEIVTTFFTCRIEPMGNPPPRVVSLAPTFGRRAGHHSSAWPQPLRWILRLARVPHLEVEARTLKRARVPHGADHLSLLHLVTLVDADVGHVGVEGVVLAPVIHDDQVPVPSKPPRVEHLTGRHCNDAGTLRDVDVDPIPERLRPE